MTVLSFITGQPVEPVAPRKQALAPVKARKRGSMPREIQKAMLAKVHIAKQRLGLDDDAYRNMLRDRFGVESSKDLDAIGMNDLLQHLQLLGFVPTKRSAIVNPGGVDAQMAKIEAMLTEKGRVEGTDVPWGYAVSILKRQTGNRVKRLQDANSTELRGVITALIVDAKRNGRRTE